MPHPRLLFITGAALILVAGARPLSAISPMVETDDQAMTSVAVRDIKVEDHGVSGEVVNRSPHPVRDVELLVRYMWRWNDEFNPGREAPGRAVYVKVGKEIRPGKSAPFAYRPSTALPDRTDGHFEIDVSVAGFTEVVPRQKATN